MNLLELAAAVPDKEAAVVFFCIFAIYKCNIQSCDNNHCIIRSQIRKNGNNRLQQLLREVCATELLANQIKFGGPGTTVKIAESQFSRRKNNQGRQPPPQWVFGGICRKTGESWLESTLKISSVIGRTQRFETKTTWNAHTHGQLVFLWMNVATTTQRPPMPIRKNIRKHCSLLATMLKCHLLPFSSNLAIL